MPQPSRKGKKEWRKNIAIDDIEEHQEDMRKQEMAGGKVMEKSNAELFVIDTAGDTEVKRKLKSKKKLRIDEILEQRTSIPAVASCHRRSTQKSQEDKRIQKLLEKKQKRKSSVVLKPASKTPSDPWTTPDVDPAFLPETVLVPVVKRPVTMAEEPLAAVAQRQMEPAHPGVSYNPRYADHVSALQTAVDEELKRLSEMDVDGSLKKTLLCVQGLDAHVTMPVDLPSDDDEESKDAEHVSGQKKSELKRKTQKERQKEMKRKLEMAEKSMDQEQKTAEQKLFEVKKLKKDLDKAKHERQQRMEERKQRKLARQAQGAVKLSRHAFRKVPMAIKLSDELTESLRTLKPEGNSFRECFNRLQQKCLVETRVPVSARRRYQLKEYEKHSYKQFK